MEVILYGRFNARHHDPAASLRSGSHCHRALPVRQERRPLGAIGGVADSFLSRNKAKTLDAKLARATKWVGAIFLILTLVLLILQG